MKPKTLSNDLTARLIFCLLITICFVALALTNVSANEFYPPQAGAKDAINFDGRGFLINGKRTFILSASIEYARVPRQLWRDRLLRIKRSGFNCIELYTFWNYHEVQEGKFDFNGDKDVGAFLDLAHELGLYATVRVGPYVCAEWENGGYPMWLRFKPPMCVRTNDPLFLNYVDKWYEQILPIVASRQIEHGGPVIMVQLENEDPRGWGVVDGDPCFKHLLEKARSLGIEVPTFFSGMNHGGDPAPKEPISSAGRANPWYSTEYWSGWYNWYGSMDPKPGGTLNHYDRAAWRFLENGGNGFNIYMFHGGSNFATWNNEETRASYDYSGAVGQAGDLRNIYYKYKRVALFATSFEAILEDCDDSTAAHKGDATGVSVAARTGPAGTLLFLDNSAKEPVTAKLADGTEMKLAGEEIVGLPRDFALDAAFKIVSTTSRTLGVVHDGEATTLVLYGPVGDAAQIRFSVTKTADQKIDTGTGAGWMLDPAHPEAVTLNLHFPEKAQEMHELTLGTKSLRVLVLNSELADDSWFIDAGGASHIVTGPRYVGAFDVGPNGAHFTGEAPFDATMSPETWVYGPDKTPQSFPSQNLAPLDLSAPALTDWKSASAIPEAEPTFNDSAWKTSDNPLPMGADGDTSAYVWYRTSITAEKDGQQFLQIPFVGDNALIFVNGQRVPSSASRQPAMVPVTLQAGPNSIAILASHLGRTKLGNDGPIDLVDQKGLIGPVRLSATGTAPLLLPEGKYQAYWKEHPSVETLVDPKLDTSDPKWQKFGFDRGLDRYCVAPGAGLLREVFACYRTTLLDFSGPNRTLHFGFSYDKATIFLNGKKIGEQTEPGVSFDVPLDVAWNKDGPNVLALIVETERRQNTLGLASLYSGTPPPEIKGWKMRGGIVDFNAATTTWDKLPEKAPGVATYYRASFTSAPNFYEQATPILRVNFKGLSRGFIWLNGHNLGRFPETTGGIGLYLPECWIKEGANDLVILDEEGALPKDVRLEIETVASRRLFQEGK